MRIQIASDLHFECVENKKSFQPSKNADLLIIAGDIGNQRSLEDTNVEAMKKYSEELPVILTLGNHDYMGSTIQDTIEFWDSQNIPNLHFLHNNTIELNGIHFIGSTLWSDVKINPINAFYISKGMIDYKYILKDDRSSLIDVDYLQNVHEECLHYVKQELNKNYKRKVLITHHLPTFMSVHPRYINSYLNAAFATDLTELLLDTENLELCIHGHTHDKFDYTIEDKVRIICNPLGYPGENMYFDSEKIIDI